MESAQTAGGGGGFLSSIMEFLKGADTDLLGSMALNIGGNMMGDDHPLKQLAPLLQGILSAKKQKELQDNYFKGFLSQMLGETGEGGLGGSSNAFEFKSNLSENPAIYGEEKGLGGLGGLNDISFYNPFQGQL